jgi:hypothetical protein
MSITRKEFEELTDGIHRAERKMLKLMKKRRPEDYEEFKGLRQYIIDEAAKVLSTAGEFCPPIDTNDLEKQWQETKAGIESVRDWGHQDSLREWAQPG